MNEIESRSIVQSVLEYDLDPPSEDYNPYDHGVTVAQGLAPEAVAPLVADCFIALPSSLARSFVEGVFAGTTVFPLDDQLIDAIPRVREVSSAGVLADLLIVQRKICPIELAIEFLTRLRPTTDTETQNRYAYAIYATFRSSDQEGRTLSRSPQEDRILDDLIGQVLSSAMLSAYARDTLEACMQRR